MKGRIEKQELVDLVARHVNRDTVTVSEIVDATLEEIYQALKRGEPVSLRDFGSFYVRPERDAWVFKFNPSQRLRKLFGWSSTYRREVERWRPSMRAIPILPGGSSCTAGLSWATTA